MTGAEARIDELIAECESVIAGEYEGDELSERINGIMLTMEGFSFPLRVTGCQHITSDRTVDGIARVRGWLMANAASLCGSRAADVPGINVSANINPRISTAATSSAVAAADATAAVQEAIDAAQADPALDGHTKDQIVELLDMARGCVSRRDPKFMDKVLRALELASKSLPVFLSVLNALTALGAGM